MALGTQDEVLLARNAWQQSCANFHGTISQTLTQPLPEPYASWIKHRLLYMFQLHHAAREGDPSRREELLGYACQVVDSSIRRYLANEVAKTHPVEAMKVLREFALTFIPDNDKDMPPGMPPPAADPAFYGFKR